MCATSRNVSSTFSTRIPGRSKGRAHRSSKNKADFLCRISHYHRGNIFCHVYTSLQIFYNKSMGYPFHRHGFCNISNTVYKKSPLFPAHQARRKRAELFSPQSSNLNCFHNIGSLSISQTPSHPSSCFSSQKHQTSRARKWIRGNLINLFIYSLQ